MIKSITVINHLGNSVALSLTDPWDTGLIITQITGLGPPKATINSTDLAMGDGAAYNSSRIDKRNIVFSFQLNEVLDGVKVLKTIEQVRLDTYKYFPLKKDVTLIFETDTRTASIQGYVESNEPDIFNEKETANISIVCTRPFFYDELETVDLLSIEPRFEFPWSNPIDTSSLIMSEIIFEVGQNVYYDGDAETGVILAIHAIGTTKKITITNNNSGEVITIDTERLQAITGSSEAYMLAKDDLVISSVSGDIYCKLYRDGKEYNALSAIPKDSDWLHLVHGDNFFTYTAEDDSAVNIIITVEGFNLYVGV